MLSTIVCGESLHIQKVQHYKRSSLSMLYSCGHHIFDTTRKKLYSLQRMDVWLARTQLTKNNKNPHVENDSQILHDKQRLSAAASWLYIHTQLLLLEGFYKTAARSFHESILVCQKSATTSVCEFSVHLLIKRLFHKSKKERRLINREWYQTVTFMKHLLLFG